MAEILTETKKRSFLNIIITVLLWLAMLIFAGHACTHMVAAGDTWVAMACGRHFVNHGVDTVEPFSYKSHKAGPTEQELEKFPEWSRGFVKKIHPTGWINQNWLTHVIFYKMATTFGSVEEPNYNMLVVWKFLLYLICLVCIYYTSRMMGATKFTSAAFCCWAMFIARTFLDIRPAGYSNVLVPIFVLILLLTTYNSYKYIWLSVPVAVFWGNVHGGYLYMFVVFVPFFVLNLIAILIKQDCFVRVDKKVLIHTVAAGIVTFIAMVIFNPYHLTNLTHTFIVTISKHAEDWRKVNEWHSGFEHTNPVGQSKPFAVMFGVFFGVMAVWLLAWLFIFPLIQKGYKLFKPFADSADKTDLTNPAKNIRENELASEDRYFWPKIDLAYIAIVIFTIYMAVKSRRFIPIAAFIACPLMAVWTDQIWRMVSAEFKFIKRGSLSPVGDLKIVKFAEIIIALVVIAVFGYTFGTKYNNIYNGPWPQESKRNSVFMRMTASYLKPFDACKFIDENGLRGRMLNYWTEGGFVAFGQTPDPETGEIPLKLFMDGRAQAAYDIETFNEYNNEILVGGPEAKRVMIEMKQGKKKRPTNEDLKLIGEWVQDTLASYDAWVILMPKNKFRSLFLRGIESLPNWKVVFYNDNQKLIVRVDDPRGEKLFRNILSGEAKYPNEYDKLVIEAMYPGYFAGGVEAAFDKLAESYDLSGDITPLYLMMSLPGADIEKKRVGYFEGVVQDMLVNIEKYRKQDGFARRLFGGYIISNYLSRNASGSGKAKYSELKTAFEKEFRDVSSQYIW